jgi:RNA polymerase sigma-70 factor (ECF subfamily)
MLHVVEQHLLAEKRDVRREISLEQIGKRLEQSTARLESLLAEPGDSPSGHAQRNEQEIMLADALAELPGDYRQVIMLRHIEGLPFEEVAERMDRSCGAVRMLWLRALERLRKTFPERELA